MCGGAGRSSVDGMTPTVRYAIWTVGIAAGALLAPAPAGAATNRPPRPEVDHSQTVIERVEVPVDDTTDEAAQMTIAAALGAAIAVVARRRRPRHQSAVAGTGLIDITDTARL
jgi:hypothetical protein